MPNQSQLQPEGEASFSPETPVPTTSNMNNNAEVAETSAVEISQPSPATTEKPNLEVQVGPGVSLSPQNDSQQVSDSLAQSASSQTIPQEDVAPEAQVDIGIGAEDSEMIEGPWVEKATGLIDKDKGNPYLEEEDHEDLQIDYLKKRFGKEIEKGEE